MLCDCGWDQCELGVDGIEFGDLVEIYLRREIMKEVRCLRALKPERAVAVRLIGEGYVVHDDEFFEGFGKLGAIHCGRDAEEAVGLGLGFDFGEDAALGTEEKGEVALAGLEIFDVVGEDGVEVAGAVGAGEGEVGEVVFVDEGDGVFCGFVFVLPVAEIVGEGAAEPGAEICAGRLVGGG